MWPRFLALLLFVSCAQAISSSDFHRNFSSEQTSVYPSLNRDIMRTEEPVEKYGIIKDALRLDTKVEENYKLSYDSRTQRGRGVYGGANVNHGYRRSQASLLPKISIVSVSLALMLLFLLLQLS